MSIVKIKQVAQKVTSTGKSYYVIDTNMGRMTTFNKEHFDALNSRIGKNADVDFVINDKGFKNIKAVKKVIEPANMDDRLTSIYTSYAKDIFIALNETGTFKDNGALMAQAIALVLKAKNVFGGVNMAEDETEPEDAAAE